MPAIWSEVDGRWELAKNEGFPDERTLHELIHQTPHMLPLAGSPQITMLGSEIRLGNGYADLIGIEATGRPVLIEIKLARNSEARRAIVAQVLAYAAALHGMTLDQLQSGPLSKALQDGGYTNIAEAVVAQDQEGAIDEVELEQGIKTHLEAGRFRLVFVLDDSPIELVSLVGYLEHIATELQIDLVTVASVDVNGSRAILPQRVTPERHDAIIEQSRSSSGVRNAGVLSDGYAEFESSIADTSGENRNKLFGFLEWAKSLEQQNLVKLVSYRGKTKSRVTLLPRIQPDDVTLVTIWNENGRAYLSAYRSVMERKCPEFIEQIEELGNTTIKQGSTISVDTEEMLALLTKAYIAANRS